MFLRDAAAPQQRRRLHRAAANEQLRPRLNAIAHFVVFAATVQRSVSARQIVSARVRGSSRRRT